MSAQPRRRLTPEDYLAIERAAEYKSEYFNGEMYPMAGGYYPHSIVVADPYAHAMIIGNLSGELRTALKNLCALAPSDLRVRMSPAGLDTYPDVAAIFGEPTFDDEKDALLNPALIAEVLGGR